MVAPSPPPDPSASISAPIVVHRARTKRAWPSEDKPVQNSLRSLKRTWDALDCDINLALELQRKPALDAVVAAVSSTPPRGVLAAVCVLMGTGAVGGDRSTIFSGVVAHLEAADFDVVLIQSTVGVGALRDDLLERAKRRKTVLAIEDADAAPPALLRDIAYVSADVVARVGGNGKNQLAMVAGCNNSALPLHSALGVLESAAVSAIVVEMPRSRQVLSSLVRCVLTRQTGGVILSRSVFQLLEDEFFTRDVTLSVLVRILRHIYILHFMQQPLAELLASPSAGGKTLIDAQYQRDDVDIHDDHLVQQLRTATMSVHECGGAELSDEELPDKVNEWAADLKLWKHRKRTVEALMWDLLVQTDAYESGIDHRVKCEKKKLRTLMFKAFLPSNDGSCARKQPIVRIVFEEIARGQRHQILAYIKIIVEALKSHTVEDDPEIASIILRFEEEDKLLRDNSSTSTLKPGGDMSTPATPTHTPRAKGSAAALKR